MLLRWNSESVETFLLDVIEERRVGKDTRCSGSVLLILSWLFTAVVKLRIWLYKQRILRVKTLGCQVISVGNLTVGGTGKTPVVEVFARLLEERGRKVAILSRGYKSRSLTFGKR